MSDQKNSEGLKECPFCGGEAYLSSDFKPEYTAADGCMTASVRCVNAKCLTEGYMADSCLGETPEDAINAWNTRSQPTATSGTAGEKPLCSAMARDCGLRVGDRCSITSGPLCMTNDELEVKCDKLQAQLTEANNQLIVCRKALRKLHISGVLSYSKKWVDLKELVEQALSKLEDNK